jgi:hypothetical protein
MEFGALQRIKTDGMLDFDFFEEPEPTGVQF